MAQLKEGSIIKKSTGDEVIATINDIPNVPTKTSELENNSGFITSSVIPTSLPANGGNADTIGGFTVGVDVPSNAKFTDNDTITTINGKTGAIVKADIVALGIPAQDTVYVHPSTHSADIITDGTTNKAYTSAEKTKLSGIATNANNYSHPTTHPSSIIVQDTSNRFVSDNEKSTWNGKQNALGYTPVNKAGDTIAGQLAVESATFPVVDIVRNTSGTGGGLYGGAKLQRKTTNPVDGIGIGFYFQAPNSNKAMTHAGMFGGALGTINAGSEKGEIVLSPSYAGQDPYSRRDFIVRAISTSKAEAELNGKLRTEQTLASDPTNTVATKKYVDDNKTIEYTHPSSHPASMITGLPTSLPANGGNADTVGGFTVGVSVPANAKFTDTIYTHPSMHPASIITESTSRRFVSDTERGQWNDKTKTITSVTEPSLEVGDQWHREY